MRVVGVVLFDGDKSVSTVSIGNLILTQIVRHPDRIEVQFKNKDGNANSISVVFSKEELAHLCGEIVKFNLLDFYRHENAGDD